MKSIHYQYGFSIPVHFILFQQNKITLIYFGVLKDKFQLLHKFWKIPVLGCDIV